MSTDLFAPTGPLIPGVFWDEKYMRWQAFIAVNGKVINLGRFTYRQSAIQVRESAEMRYGPSQNVNDLFSLERAK
jgi:hypothetical protein